MDFAQLKMPGYKEYYVIISCLSSFSNGWAIGSANVPGEVAHACENGAAHMASKAFPDYIPKNNALWGFDVASFCVGGLIDISFVAFLVVSPIRYFFGILLASIIVLPLARVSLWGINYAIVAIPATTQFLIADCVESPRDLVSINCIEETREKLQRLRPDSKIDKEFYGMVEGQLGTAASRVAVDADAAFIEDRKSLDNQIEEDVLIRRITLTFTTLHITQQLISMNAAMYYSTSIFNTASGAEMSKYMAIVTTVVDFASNILSLILLDRMGRRALLIVAKVGA
ncbi:hypothetical protein MAM1_0349c09923 [Mucor ambiguus]|uniref:Major facilitator superfamily (MFS) profile domain-containing protein n=1 Tax=Mucor ambiguus TaxID=91626 RepID=A0A0C9N6Z5_9FUNG|nr:hypothetical protein MAM1_0349c09923 [Mucor ambiguus]